MHNGHVPDLFTSEEIEAITSSMRALATGRHLLLIFFINVLFQLKMKELLGDWSDSHLEGYPKGHGD